MIATVESATILGVEGQPVRVEVHVSNGLPAFNVVGQPDAAVREARDRVRAALLSSGLPFKLARVTVNLAPAGVRKAGSQLDLPIAVGLLVAEEHLPPSVLDGVAFLGELGLDGSIRPVAGMVPLAAACDAATLVVPRSSAREAALAGRHVRPVGDLRELVEALTGDSPWPPMPGPPPDPVPLPVPDLGEVRGQRLGRWAVEVAAAGGHHLLLSGPPGAGKSMLARRLPGLLPPLSTSQALEVTMVHSAGGLQLPPGGLVERPPFRAPHHGVSAVALIGGGHHTMRPGEVSFAHHGVLFIDELGEVPAAILDALRQPIEEGQVRVSRARASVTLPSRFLLVGAMNPCPCGEAGRPGACRCSAAMRAKYLRRLSGPLLDRFDLRVAVQRADVDSLLGGPPGEPTAVVAERVERVRAWAAERGVATNAEIPAERLDDVAPLSPAAQRVLEHKLRIGALTARGLHRVRRVARTLADLAGDDGVISEEHVCGALELRTDVLPALEAA